MIDAQIKFGTWPGECLQQENTVLHYSVICWFAKNAAESDARRAIILALFVYDLIGLIATAITGILNPLGWLVVFVYLFFTVGFGYFLVKPPTVKA